jgi:hypothetical protein
MHEYVWLFYMFIFENPSKPAQQHYLIFYKSFKSHLRCFVIFSADEMQASGNNIDDVTSAATASAAAARLFHVQQVTPPPRFHLCSSLCQFL